MSVFLIFVAFVVLGVYIYHGYRTRKLFFESLLAFCNHLQTEISFSKNGISHIIETYANSYHQSLRRMLLQYKHQIDNKQDINLTYPIRLKPSEKSHLNQFFMELGKHSSDQETTKIENRKVFFASFFDSANLALKRDASMYLKFCIILGIVAVVLLL